MTDSLDENFFADQILDIINIALQQNLYKQRD